MAISVAPSVALVALLVTAALLAVFVRLFRQGEVFGTVTVQHSRFIFCRCLFCDECEAKAQGPEVTHNMHTICTCTRPQVHYINNVHVYSAYTYMCHAPIVDVPIALVPLIFLLPLLFNYLQPGILQMQR